MNMEKNKIKTSTGEKIFTVFNYAFFTLLCLVMLYPFWHEIMLSFSSLEASMKGGIFLWPKGFNLDTYKSVFKNPNIYTGFRTTIIVTIAGTALGTLLTAMTAYPLSKSRLRGGKVLMTLVLFTMIFSAGMIPSFLLIQNIGLMDNILALILPGLVSAYNCIIMKSFFLSIPESLEESARIDGANAFQQFTNITLPYMLFVMTPYLITQFTGNINNFNVIYLLTRGEPMYVGNSAGGTDLLVTWLYKLSVDQQKYNLAAVIGIFTFVVLSIVSLVTYRSSGSYKDEEGFK